jgi:hypothetical protein
MRINSLKAGLAVGAAMAAGHAVWAMLVWLGWAQMVADFMFWIHFIRPLYTIMPFDPGKAGLLVLTTGLAGFLIGWTLAVFWNRFTVHRGAPP